MSYSLFAFWYNRRLHVALRNGNYAEAERVSNDWPRPRVVRVTWITPTRFK